MEKIDGMPLYWLANSLGELQEALKSPTATLTSVVEAVRRADYNINSFTDVTFGPPLSKDAAKEIVAGMHKLFAIRPFPEVGIPVPLTQEEKNWVFVPIWNLQAILARELPQLNLFLITQHRAYDMTILINNGEKLLSEASLNCLSVSRLEVIREVKEAARCLAFNVATAVGLHLSRAVESVIIKEYFPAAGVVIPKHRNLGRYIEALEKVNKVNQKVIGKLRDFKDYYRNLIAHPEEYWNIDNADSAFGTAINLIEAITHDIDDLRREQSGREFAEAVLSASGKLLEPGPSRGAGTF